MVGFNRDAFYQFMIDEGVVGFFKDGMRLSSGRTSHWYVNWRRIYDDSLLIDKLADFLISFTENILNLPDAFYGVPEGCSKLGIISTYKLAISGMIVGDNGRFFLPMGRGKPKQHGASEDRFFIGFPRGRVIVVEDVVTTGGSLINELNRLKDANVDVAAAIVLTDRMELDKGGKGMDTAMKEMNIPYYAMTDASKLLPLAYRTIGPDESIAKAIEAEYKNYGRIEVKLY